MAMQIQGSYISCGIKQLYGLAGDEASWRASLRGLERQMYSRGCSCPACAPAYTRALAEGKSPPPSCRFLIFSDPDCNGYGKRFAEFLERTGLGKPVEMCSGINPNSGNLIRLWSWEIPDYLTVFRPIIMEGK